MKVVSPPGTPPRRPAGIAAGGEKWSVPFGKPLSGLYVEWRERDVPEE